MPEPSQHRSAGERVGHGGIRGRPGGHVFRTHPGRRRHQRADRDPAGGAAVTEMPPDFSPADGASAISWASAARCGRFSLVRSLREATARCSRCRRPLGPSAPPSRRWRRPPPITPAVSELARHLRLSPFERDVLLLCAAVEVDPELGAALPTVDRRPSLALALSLFSGADWGAIFRARRFCATGSSCHPRRESHGCARPFGSTIRCWPTCWAARRTTSACGTSSS